MIVSPEEWSMVSNQVQNLNQSEEEKLGKYLKHCAKLRYGKTRKDVLSIVRVYNH